MQKNNIGVYGVIYKITNLINGKVYIGQTKNNFHKRYHNNLLKYSHSKHLKSSIKKYGVEYFEVNPCIDVAFSAQELNIKEKCYIRVYNSYLNGYNLTLGGEGVKGLPKELHGMYGVHRYGNKNPFYGKKHTERVKDILRIKAKDRNMVGENNPNYNNGDKIKGSKNPMFGVSPKERMSEEQYDIWKSKLISNLQGSKNPKAKKIINITTGEIFGCIKDAKQKYGAIAISDCCRGKCRTAGGYEWKYYKDYINEITRREVAI